MIAAVPLRSFVGFYGGRGKILSLYLKRIYESANLPKI
jgi:hypothetical protein